ncbi:MAG TPA: peptidoglycan-binding domain-containing protein, partial [Candidatus Acidoferrum sp.]|nr:peptidoglycan-binding domain-containing protein [Candidatus Acidoferrum sp.]
MGAGYGSPLPKLAGKGVLTEGLAAGPETEGAGLLGATGLERATRNNPIYHRQLRYDPAVFGAGNDVRTEEYAVAVARYQQAHGLVVDGMAGPVTVGHVLGRPQPDGGKAPDGKAPDGKAPGPGPEAPPAPAPPAPRTEQTEHGTFIVYPDSFVGPLPPGGPQGEHVRESEYRRILAQRQTAAVAAREQAVSRIDDLLSYGAFDWAITDGEATEALNLLAALPMSQLQVALGRIDAQRLLDNVPSKARRTPAFARVIIAMGPAKYRPFIRELLSYGALDWAIRDAEIQVVIDILMALPGPQQLVFLRSLEPVHLSRLSGNLGRGVQVSDDMLKAIFDVTPDTDLAAMESTFERRFHVDLSTWFLRRWQMSIKQKWDAPGLRRLWTLFEQLPPGHIQDNERLDTFLRESSTDGSGVYYGGPEAAAVSYGDVNARGNYGGIMVPDGAGGQRDVGLNSNVNLFSTVVRHEVGHAVDAKIGASGEGGYTSTAASAGQWRSYDSSDEFVNAIISAGGGMSGHGYPDEELYRRAMLRAVSDEEDFAEALREVDSKAAAPEASVTGPVAAVLDKGRWHPDSSPWYTAGDRLDVG